MLPITDPFWPRLIVVLLLSLSPFFFVVVQQRAVRRQQDILRQFAPKLQQTQLWQEASRLLDRRYFLTSTVVRSGGGTRASPGAKPGSGAKAGVGSERSEGPAPSKTSYLISLGVVSLLMLTSWSFLLEEPFGLDWYVKASNLFLSGPPSGVVPPATTEGFQTDTLAVSGIAFAVAYVVVIRRMLMRLNINEHSSLENLFDAVHLTGAIVIASVGKVVLQGAGAGLGPQLFFAVGTGVRPDFYLAALAQAAFDFLTRTVGFLTGMRDPARKQISPDDMPPAVQLEAIDGLCGGVLGRVQRIDIETCQRMAFANPFVVSCRVSWNVKEVVDWIDQALLIVHLPSHQKALNGVGIRTVSDLLNRLKGAQAGLSSLGIAVGEAALRAQLLAVPQIELLQELVGALRPVAQGATGAAQNGAPQPGSTGGPAPQRGATGAAQDGVPQPGGTGEPAPPQGATGAAQDGASPSDGPTGGPPQTEP